MDISEIDSLTSSTSVRNQGRIERTMQLLKCSSDQGITVGRQAGSPAIRPSKNGRHTLTARGTMCFKLSLLEKHPMPSPSGQCMEEQHSSSQLLTSDPWYLNGAWAMTSRTSYCFCNMLYRVKSRQYLIQSTTQTCPKSPAQASGCT